MSASVDLGALATLFQQTLEPAQRKTAEAHLTQLESSAAASLCGTLLDLVAQPGAAPSVRLAAAIKLKNMARRAWAEDEESEAADSSLVPPAQRDVLKQRLLPLIAQLSSGAAQAAQSSASLRLQLADCVALIANKDFPERWPTLIDELVSGLALPPGSPALSAVLHTAHSIFRRWRAAFRSNELYTQIIFVLDRFASPFLDLLKRTDEALVASPQPQPEVAASLVLCLQVYHDLSAQDLPPAFEDSLSTFMPLLLRHLNPTSGDASSPGVYSLNPALAALEGDADDTSPASPQRARAEICSIAELYSQRYLDAFGDFVPAFVKGVWEMLGNEAVCGKGEKYDLLVSRAISLLSTIVRMPSQRSNFEADATLEAFVQAIILPNIALREADEEMFEDEPMEWVRREFASEGGENETRRRSATSFTRALLEQFSSQITAIISRYVGQFLQEYAGDRSKWRGKDTAVYLLSSIASTGGTTMHGASSMNNLVDVVQFFSDHVFEDLQADASTVHPILQVDAIKYLHTFRQQLTKEQLLSVLPLLVRHLESQNYVTCSYAAITIERVLFIKQDRRLLFTSADVQPFAESILMALFRNIQSGATPEKLAENDYLMKCVMRVILTCREALAPFHQPILERLTAILVEISKNPSNPRFSQFCFESISALIRYVTAADASAVAGFEQRLSGPFMNILQNDVTEFAPYVFQVLSQMLELHKGDAMPQSYVALLPSLLTPTLWQSRGNVPALVRLLQAFLARGGAKIAANNQISPILGIYQQLISSRINDEYGFELLQSLFANVSAAQMDQYKKAVLTLMLTRLQTSKTEKFSRGFIGFVAEWACTQQPEYPDYVVLAFDAVQPGLFPQILQGVIVPDLKKIPQRRRRVVATGLARLLTQGSAMLSPPNVGAWPAAMAAVLQLLQEQAVVSTGGQAEEEEIFAQDWEDTGFQASFSVLAASAAPVRDAAAPFAGADARVFLSQQLAALRRRDAAQVSQLLAAVPREVLEPFSAFMAQRGDA